MLILRMATILFTVTFTFGCVPTVVRDTANLTSQSVDQIKNEIETYQKVLEVDARQRIKALARQKESIAEAEASLTMQLAAW